MMTSLSIRTFITSGHDVKAMASCGPGSNCAAPVFSPRETRTIRWLWSGNG